MITRRLVEAGARFVTVTYGAWDTHAFHYRGIETQLPDLDRAFAGLIQDLDQRGMLDSTLVLVTSEFGRTPKVNAGGGRDHTIKFSMKWNCRIQLADLELFRSSKERLRM